MGKSRSNRTRLYAVDKERQLGIVGATSALDWFTNMAARTGFGTPNLAESADYEMVRFSYDYWKLLTLYRNHWISRRIVDVPAGDMVRAWPRLTSDISPEDVGNVEKLIRKTYTKANLLKALQWARLFGGAGALIVIEGQEEYLDEPLNLEDVKLDAYKGVIPFDRWAGITPDGAVCTDINKPTDFNKPEFYEVHNSDLDSFKVHSSRILRFTGPEVPTPEREAQSWWGISVLEPVYEEIKKRDNMSWNILSLTFRANLLGMKYPELAQLISGVGIAQGAKQKLAQRMEEINHLMSNQSLIPLPAEGGLESVQYTFSGLSEVYQQFQLDISGAAEIPVTRLWGRTITGLGQSNDADERIYEEKIGREQETDLRPQLEKLYPVLCMSELGEVPDDLDLAFPSVRVLDEKEKSELAKTVVDTVTVALNSGGISPRTYAKELKQSSDITGIFTNITDEQIESMSDEVQSVGGDMPGMLGEEGGVPQLNPSASPSKVMHGTEQEKNAKQEKNATNLSHSEDWLRDYHARAQDDSSSDFEELAKQQGWKCSTSGGRLIIEKSRGWVEVGPRGSWKWSVGGNTLAKGNGLSSFKDYFVRAQDADGPAAVRRVVHGMDVVIETAKGYVRGGWDEEHQRSWEQIMPYDYGYLKGIKGADGDSLDVMLGSNPSSAWVYVIDQRHLPPQKGFDEHKVMMGYDSQAEALSAYRRGHHRSKDVLMDWTPMHVNDFKKWVRTADMAKPCSTEV